MSARYPYGSPRLVTIPSNDADFRMRVTETFRVARPATTTGLEDALRAGSPRVHVQASVVADVPTVWYVYRDGRFSVI